MDSHPSKRVLVNNGSKINITSSITLERLKVPIWFLNYSTLTIRAFENTLEIKMGIVILQVRVGVREITTTYHVLEGEMSYNLLLGQP